MNYYSTTDNRSAKFRQLLFCLVGIVATLLVFSGTGAKRTASTSAILDSQLWNDDDVFTGEYSDPNHPNCKRLIEVSPRKLERDEEDDNENNENVIVSGTDGNPGCPPDGSGELWTVRGSVNGDQIVVDFSPKGGPEGLMGKRVPEGIKWQDNNIWKLL